MFGRETLRQDPFPGQPRVYQMGHSAEYVLDAEQRLVIVKFGKKLTISDIERYTERLRKNPSFHPTFSEIVDLSEVREIDIQADEFLRLADEVDPFSPTAKRAFVARSSAQTNAARMHKILRTQRNIEIFPTLADAELWVKTQSAPYSSADQSSAS